MKPAPFRYHAPKTIEEAVATLAEVAGEDGRVLAGGQSLVPIMAFRLARPAHLVDINGVEALDASRSTATSCRSAPACAMPPSTGRWSTVRSDGCSPRSCATSRTIRSAPAAPSAAASRMPIRPPNGAWWRRRSTPRWWRGARAAPARSRRGFFPRHHDHGARRGRAADRGAPADPAGRHALRLLRVQPPCRRLCARHGAGRPIASRTAS